MYLEETNRILNNELYIEKCWVFIVLGTQTNLSIDLLFQFRGESLSTHSGLKSRENQLSMEVSFDKQLQRHHVGEYKNKTTLVG